MTVQKTHDCHTKFDMHDVFTIVLVDPNDPDKRSITGTKDIYTNYTSITIEQVAASNEWYCTCSADEWYNQNLMLTFDFTQNHTSVELATKVFETYDDYPFASKGGPLFFILMINQLLSTIAEAVQTLEDCIETSRSPCSKVRMLIEQSVFSVALLHASVK